MLSSAWIFGGVIFASESEQARENSAWLRILGAILGFSLVTTLLYWLWHAGALAQIFGSTPASIEEVLVKVSQYEGLLTRYLAFLLILVLGLAFFLAFKDLGRAKSITLYGAVLGSILLVVALGLSAYTNLRIVQADIAFKLADPFTSANSWPVAISVYNRATRLAPAEDFYYLFLGRAYLESAKSTSDTAGRDSLIREAESKLKKAQEINPLNTDHTANLARLYSLWATMTSDEKLRQERAELSDFYFQRAVALSPNNSRIWDEWALIYLNVLNKPEEALQRLNHSLKIDPLYDFTQALMAEYYLQQVKSLSDPQAQSQAYDQAIRSYQEAIQRATDLPSRVNYLTSLAQIFIDRGQPGEAITAIRQAIELSPQSADRWRYEQTLAQLYQETGNKAAALEHANQALAMAPENQQPAVQSLIAQLQSSP